MPFGLKMSSITDGPIDHRGAGAIRGTPTGPGIVIEIALCRPLS